MSVPKFMESGKIACPMCGQYAPSETVPSTREPCVGDTCKAASVDGVICANGECDYAIGVRKPPRTRIVGYEAGRFIREPVRDETPDKDYLSLVKTLRDPDSVGRALPLDMAANAIEELLRELAEYEGGKGGDVPPAEFSEVGKRNWRIGYWMDQVGKAKLQLAALRKVNAALSVPSATLTISDVEFLEKVSEKFHNALANATTMREPGRREGFDMLIQFQSLLKALKKTRYVGEKSR